MWRLALLVGLVAAGDATARNKGPEPLPEKAVKAWKDAGAIVGWMGPRQTSGFTTFTTNLGELDAARAVPAFRFKTWSEGTIRKLQAPARPFGLDLSGARVTDAGLKELARLKNLSHLYLHATQVTDAGLKELATLKGLMYLDLGRTKVTGAGLKDLSSLKRLTSLDLRFATVTDAGLRGLAHLKNLAVLYLRFTRVTDAGLKELAPLKGLSYLDLYGTHVTGTGVKELAPLKNLSYLGLSEARVTDKALRALREAGHLHTWSNAGAEGGKRPTGPEEVTSLSLVGTQVTGAALKELAGLKNLSTLWLADKQVTDSALRALREAGMLHALRNARAEGGKRPTRSEEVISLSLHRTQLTDAALKDLASLKNLSSLDLRFTKVTEAGVQALQKALPKCRISR